MSLRKRTTTKHSPTQTSHRYLQNRDLDTESTKSKSNVKKCKIFPVKNSSNEFGRNSSRDSSECETDINWQKNVSYKNEERSQLICYKDNTKIIAIKNDSKFTKYNTFDIKSREKSGKLMKYKSLDEPETKALVKYLDKASNVSISAEDFNSDFRLLKYGQRKPKHDIIVDTVDVWAKKSSKNMFTNIKKSIFKNNTAASQKDVVFKPLVFGGTYPIDAPTDAVISQQNIFHKPDRKTVNTPRETFDKIASGNTFEKFQKSNRNKMKFREYGPAKSFDIDVPI